MSRASEAALRERVDFYEAFAQRLPLRVICEVLGIPSVDCAEFARFGGFEFSGATPGFSGDSALRTLEAFPLRLVPR